MKPRHALLVTALLGATILSTSAFASSLSTQDFVQKASVANEFEIESSEVALERSQNADVKKFAQQMVDDHTKTGEKMKAVLANSKLEPADHLDREHQQLLDKLKTASDDKFDRRYIHIQTDAHHQAVDLFSDYSQNGKDPALKDFATQTLPTLKKHLAHVEQLSAAQ